jgi:chromosome segregation ATPase
MAETTVTRNLSQIDAQLKELSASLKSCTTDSKSLDNALKLDPTSMSLASVKTGVLKEQIDLAQQKLSTLKEKQSEYDRQVAAGVPVDQEQYRKLNVQIAETQSQITLMKQQTGALNTQSLETLKTQFSGISKVALGVLAAIVAIGVEFATTGSAIEKNAEALNVSAETYQEMSNVFEKTTGSADNYKTAMSDVTTVLANISKGSTRNEEALKSLGLTMDDLKGKTPAEALQIIETALSNVADADERAVLATALLGDSGTAVAKVAGLTASEVSTLNDNLKDNGELTNQQAADAKTLEETYTDLKKQFQEVAAQLGESLMPLFKSTAKILEDLAPLAEGLANGFAALGPAGQIAVVGALAFLAALPGLISGVIALKSALDALSSNPVMLAVAAVVAAGAIIGGAALLSSSIANAVSSSAAPTTSTTTTTNDNSTTNVYVKSDSDPDEIVAAVVNAKKQKGYV